MDATARLEPLDAQRTPPAGMPPTALAEGWPRLSLHVRSARSPCQPLPPHPAGAASTILCNYAVIERKTGNAVVPFADADLPGQRRHRSGFRGRFSLAETHTVFHRGPVPADEHAFDGLVTALRWKCTLETDLRAMRPARLGLPVRGCIIPASGSREETLQGRRANTAWVFHHTGHSQSARRGERKVQGQEEKQETEFKRQKKQKKAAP